MWSSLLLFVGVQLCVGLPRQQLRQDVDVMESTRVNCKVEAVVTYPSTADEGTVPTVECTNKCSFKTESKDETYFVGYVYRHFERLEKEYGMMVQIRYNRGANGDKSCTLVPANANGDILSTHIEGNSACVMTTAPSTTVTTLGPSTIVPTTPSLYTDRTTLPPTTVSTTVPVTHDFFTTEGTTLPPTTMPSTHSDFFTTDETTLSSTTVSTTECNTQQSTTMSTTYDDFVTTEGTTLPPTTVPTTAPVTHDFFTTEGRTLPSTIISSTVPTTEHVTHDFFTSEATTPVTTTVQETTFPSTTLPYHTTPSTTPTTVHVTHDFTTEGTTLPLTTTEHITHDFFTSESTTPITTTVQETTPYTTSTTTLPTTTTTTTILPTITTTTTLPTTTTTTTITTPPTTTTSLVCGSDWILIGRACFHISDARGDWSEGQDYCAGLGATLASVRSQEEQDDLADLIYDNAWIGLHDMHSEGEHRWEDQTTLSYTNWEPGQPDNSGTFLWWGSGEDCVEINSGYSFRWNDQDCDNQNIFICRSNAVLQG